MLNICLLYSEVGFHFCGKIFHKKMTGYNMEKSNRLKIWK
jgi:hypothetical protein